MPTPKTVSAYPPEYFDLFKKATMKQTIVKLPNHREAAYLRLQLYGFRAALVEDDQADPELALLASGLMFRIIPSEVPYAPGEPRGHNLIIEPREQSSNLKAIRDAI